MNTPSTLRHGRAHRAAQARAAYRRNCGTMTIAASAFTEYYGQRCPADFVASTDKIGRGWPYDGPPPEYRSPRTVHVRTAGGSRVYVEQPGLPILGKR